MTSKNVNSETYICYLDILGFRRRFGTEDFKKNYEKLIGEIKKPNDKNNGICLLSDSIIVFSENLENVKKSTREFYTWGIRNDFWIRGAITKGKIEKPNLKDLLYKDKFIFPYLGEGYLNALELESKLNLAGIIIDKTLIEFFKEDIDYIRFEEYLPKEGHERAKELFLPDTDYQKLIESMYFEEMLKSHLDDIEKYINTFCFFLFLFLKRGDIGAVHNFLEELLKQLEAHGRRILIPSKVIIIFIALVDGLLKRCRDADTFDRYTSPPPQIELYISTIIDGLKKQGHLSAFTDYLLEYDNKRHTSLYRDIYDIRSNIKNFKKKKG